MPVRPNLVSRQARTDPAPEIRVLFTIKFYEFYVLEKQIIDTDQEANKDKIHRRS